LFILTYASYVQGVVFFNVIVAAALMVGYVFGLRPILSGPLRDQVTGGLGFLGRYSFEIFLIHQPLIREYAYYCLGRFWGLGSPGPGPLVLAMLAGFALTLVLSVELQRLLARLPFGRQSSAKA
jgi:peptidoglycan/LPS O-acetylase OafA/YrhL